jgi:hypothetical protein
MEVVDRNCEGASDASVLSAPLTPTDRVSSQLPVYSTYIHRFLGITLLSLTWYACTSGIVLQAQNYPQEDQQRLMKIFCWGVTSVIAGIIFFIGYVIRPE